MGKKRLLFAATVVLVSLLLTGCGVPRDRYDALLAERDQVLIEAASLQAEMESLRDDLSEAESRISALESQLSRTQDELSGAKSDLSRVENDLATAQGALTVAQSRTVEAESRVSALEEMLNAVTAELEALSKVILLFDHFEDGDTVGWDLEGDWSVVQEGDNHVLKGVGPCSAGAGSVEWTDYVLEVRVKFSQSADLSFRSVPANGTRYLLGIVPDEPILYRESPDRRFLVQSGQSLEQDTWIDLRVEVRGNRLEIYADRILAFVYTDSTPLPRGRIGFGVPEHSVLHLDDLVVTVTR